MVHTKETLHQESHVKSEDIFSRNTHFQENYFFRKFQVTFVRKKICAQLPFGPNHPYLLTSTSIDGWWELECFHKMSACWKTHYRIMYENLGVRLPLAPSADAHASTVPRNIKLKSRAYTFSGLQRWMEVWERSRQKQGMDPPSLSEFWNFVTKLMHLFDIFQLKFCHKHSKLVHFYVSNTTFKKSILAILCDKNYINRSKSEPKGLDGPKGAQNF